MDVISIELVTDLLVLEGVAEVVGIRLETVLRGGTSSSLLVLLPVLLGIVDHALDLLLRETALVVGDSYAIRLAGCDVENTVGVDVEVSSICTRSRRNTGELELAEQVVVLGACTLTLAHLDEHTRLIIGV